MSNWCTFSKVDQELTTFGVVVNPGDFSKTYLRFLGFIVAASRCSTTPQSNHAADSIAIHV
jgi:hypothetical protein